MGQGWVGGVSILEKKWVGGEKYIFLRPDEGVFFISVLLVVWQFNLLPGCNVFKSYQKTENYKQKLVII